MEKITQEGAIQMFNMCAYFAPEKIPVEMFVRGSGVLPYPLQGNIADILEKNKILRDLTRYSLLSWGRNDNTSADETTVLYMHRLLQEVVQKSFGEDSNWLAYCLDLTCKVVDWVGKDGWEIKNAFELESSHTIKIADKSFEVFANNNRKLKNVTQLYFYNSVVDAKLLLFDTGLSYIEKCIGILERICIEENSIENKNNLFFYYINKGFFHASSLEYQKAIMDYDKSIKLGKDLKTDGCLADESILALAFMNRGIAYRYIKQYDKALLDENRSIEIYECLYISGILDDENAMALAYMNRGATYGALMKNNESLLDINKSIEIWEKMKNEGKKVNENQLAKAYVNRGVSISKVMLEKNKGSLSNDLAAIYNRKSTKAILNCRK